MGAHRARAVAVGIAILSWCTYAGAFPTSRLTYARGNGADACPDETTVRQAVAARLGYDPFFAAADKTIVARILRSRDELRATVELVDDKGIVRGVREFKAKAGQCEELVATMALAISIAIDPTNPGILGGPPKAHPEPPPRPTPASRERSTPKSPPIAPASPPQPPEADVAEPKDEPEAPAPKITFRTTAAVLAAFGTAPSPTAGLVLSAGLRRGLWSLAAEGRGELPGTTDVPGGRIRTSLWAGALVPCIHWDPLSVCATAWLGSLRAQGLDFPASRLDHALYAAAGVRLGLDIPISEQWAFHPAVDVLGPLFPVNVTVDGWSQWQAPQVSALFRAGVAARFP
jgi:hypothetical protein